MRVLIIMGGFFPGQKYGGPPVSIDNLTSLIDDHQFYIITSNHDLGDSEKYRGISNGWNKRKENLMVKYVSDKEYGYKCFESSIMDINPDLIYLQGLFQRCVLPTLILAQKNKIPVLLAPRGELCEGAFKKKYKKVPYLCFLRIAGLTRRISYQSTSEEESRAIVKHLGATTENIFFLNNIPSIPDKKEDSLISKESGSLRLVFVSRIVAKKNLLFAIRSLDGITGNILFSIFGPIEDAVYWSQCQKEISRLHPNISVEYNGVLSHDRVQKMLSSYHAFLFPTLSENYGHVIVEAMLSGCIPVISDQTPWCDVNDFRCGWALPLSTVDTFKNAIQELVNMDNNSFMGIRNRLQNYLSNKLSLSETKSLYQKAMYEIVRKNTLL